MRTRRVVNLLNGATLLGLLVASRVRTIEGASGLANFVMLPMWLVSGVFFSSERFPDRLQPLIRALPLTALNDALRGIDPAVTRTALTDIVTRLKARGIAVMLCGMLAPPNYGADFAARFNTIYPDIAKSSGVPLYPFFLEGVAADAKLNQADGMHPTAEGVDIIVKNILPTVEALLSSISRRAS